jgi:hypothetical protein
MSTRHFSRALRVGRDVPIVALGQESAWAPMVKPWEVGEIPLWRWLAISVMWFEIIFGWALGLLAVAVVSGAIRRDRAFMQAD